MADSLTILNMVGVNEALSPPLFMAYQSAGQAITSGFTGLAMSFGNPAVDSYGGWSSGTPTRYTPQSPGWYLFVGSIGFPTNNTGTRLVQLQKNGSVTGAIGDTTNALSSSSYNCVLQITGLFQMNGTTDYLELWGYQDSGSTLTTLPGSTFLTALKIHT